MRRKLVPFSLIVSGKGNSIRIFTSLNLPWIFPCFKRVIPQGRGVTALSHLCVIDQAWGQDSWTLAKFFFAVLWTEAKSGSMRRPMSSHLDRTSWLMKDWLYGQKENFYAGPTREILAWDQVHSGGKTKKNRPGTGAERKSGEENGRFPPPQSTAGLASLADVSLRFCLFPH